ncbi:response regulator [Skermanella rosea]|uniref:response regulator n=1 Tax=Skermanella rosea TaxID=1817965 RepID=UPI001933AA91|nr:response regulator [Skermanella rosea]UEM03072.1 response regulator [Skermanella rosea]
MAQAVTASRNERLLVVEDDEFSQQLIELYLRKAGFTELTVANDGRQALDLAKANSFDLILLDLNLPRIGGTEVVRRLKKEGLLANTPVVVISAITNMEDTIQCIEMGATDYLAKPFNVMQLQQRVDACLERRRLRQEAAVARESQALDRRTARALRTALARQGFPPSGPGFPVDAAVLAEPGAGGAEPGLGGDFHDVLTAPGGGTCFLVGTVSGLAGGGSGVAAVLTAARVRALARAAVEKGADPAAVIASVGRELDGGFPVGLFVGLFPPGGGALRHANAGMPAPVVLSGVLGVLPLAGRRGPPLGGEGAEEGASGGELSLQPGDGLVVYTRGLADATDAAGATFGEQRLRGVLESLLSAAPEVVAASLREDAAAFTGAGAPKDDVTIVALRLRG